MTEKRIFYITANQLTVYWSVGKQLHRDASFIVEKLGYEQFAEYIKEHPDFISDILVDVIEEEFRIDTMPHVYGRDRIAIQERKLKQLYHNTRFRRAEVQDREKTGRRDDQVLLTALTNPEQLEQWLGIMLAHKVPVAGIFSMPIIAQHFLKKLAIQSEHTLLFVPEQNGMLRQTYFYRLSVKSSRLLPIGENIENDFGKFLINETFKNQRYLNRLRLLSPGNILDVHILCEQSQVDNTLPFYLYDFGNSKTRSTKTHQTKS
jgi:hypothetical protein